MTTPTNPINDHDIREGRKYKSDRIADLIGLRMLAGGELQSESGELLAAEDDCRHLYFVLSGGGMIRDEDRTHQIGKEMAFLLLPEEERVYQADQNDPWQCAWISLTGSACDGLLKAIGFSSERPYIRLDQTMMRIARRTLKDLHEDVEIVKDDPLEMQLRTTSKLLQLFALLRECTATDGALGERMQDGDPDGNGELYGKRDRKGLAYVKAAEQYIREHYSEPLRMDDLAKAIGITPYYLSHVFKQYRNSSPSKVLAQIRIEDSKRLLQETDWPIGTVAKKSGYPNTLNFSKVFRKMVGCSPSTYRNLKTKITQKAGGKERTSREWINDI